MFSPKCKLCHDSGIFPCDDAIPVCPFDDVFDKICEVDRHRPMDND